MVKRSGNDTPPGGADKPGRLATRQFETFKAFSSAVFECGDLPETTRQLIAVAVAHVTQCPHCIEAHARAAVRAGATSEEIMEAIWIAAEMRAGAAFAHSKLAFDALRRSDGAR